MRTLFITNTYLNEASGVANASKSFIKAFAHLSTVFSLVYPENCDCNCGIQEDNIQYLPVADKRNKIKKMIGILVGKTHRYSNETRKLFDKSKYDIVVFDASIVSFHLIKKAKAAGLKTITIHHNYQIEYTKDDIKFPLKVPVLFWTYFFERDAVRNSDINITLTNHDACSLAKHYCPNGIFEVLGAFDYSNKSLSLKEPLKNSTQEYYSVFIITGQLSSIQTEESLLQWLNTYYPILKRKIPNSKLIVAGRNPSLKLINECKNDGVEIIPSPKDMNEILGIGDYYICPTSLGSGLKYRIMDGLGMGLQVLTHERSSRGYEEMEKQGVLYSYSNQSSFNQQLDKLIKNKKLKVEVFSIYQSHFSFDAGVSRLENILIKHGLL